MKDKRPAERVLSAILAEQWLITNDGLNQILEIAKRENKLTPEMISAFQGKQNGREYMVTMYDDTAVMDIQGPVFRYANLMTMYSGATSTETVSSELARLERDDKVKRVLPRYDTPGGMASGASEMSTQLQNFSKPLASFCTGQCCSLGYFWAAQGSQIIVAEDAIVGNIGTRTQAPGERSDKDIVSKNAPNKLLSRSAIQDVVDSLEDIFVKHVAHGRGVSVEHVVKNFGQGGVFIGQAAVEAGLADSVGTLDSILGGDFPADSSARKRVISLSSKTGEPMSNEDQNAGGITDAEHKKAVADAKAEGIREGEANKAEEIAAAEAKATSTATTAERDRCTGIVEAGENKPYKFMSKLVKNGATIEEASDYLGDLPNDSNLSQQMRDSNPDINNNAPDNQDEDEKEASSAYLSGASEVMKGDQA